MRRFAVLVSNPPRMFSRTLAAAIVIPLALWSLSVSAETRFEVNPAQSAVHFSLADTLHSFGGVFQIASANFEFSRKSDQMGGKIIVEAASGNSGSSARDHKMKKEELKAKEYPNIVFVPKSYSGKIAASGSSQIQVSGTFTLLNQPHALTVPMTVNINGNHCTATGTFEVPYVKWGLKNPSMFMIRMQKHVKIDLRLVGQLSPSK